MDIHCFANGEKNGASFRESFRRRSEIKTAFFYPSDLVNTKTTIPLRVGEERWLYTSTLRIHVTHCFSSCAVFAFLRFFYDSIYYGVVALSDIPGKWSKCCGVPCVCYSESTLHFPSNYHSVIFPFGCTGECSRCMLFCYIKAAYKLFVLVTL